MNPAAAELLRTWLGLPPGAWPPDHYALLGFAPGTGTPDDIEARVLERMEVLRAYQLKHPDAVTEGMNRLAQALVCLTDPVARTAHDRALGIAPAPFEVVEDEPPAPGPRAATAAQVELPFEVVDDAPPPFEVVDDLPPAFEEVPEPPPTPRRARGKAPKLKKRPIYRKLTALRAALRAWDDLRPVLGATDDPLATPVAVLLFLQALREARRELPRAGFALARAPAGRLVLALVHLPAAVPTVRAMLPSQRAAVARDWRGGRAILERERARLRALVRPGRRAGRSGAHLARLAARAPELCLVLAAAVVLIIALARRAP